jgi:hypothetical protein
MTKKKQKVRILKEKYEPGPRLLEAIAELRSNLIKCKACKSNPVFDIDPNEDFWCWHSNSECRLEPDCIMQMHLQARSDNCDIYDQDKEHCNIIKKMVLDLMYKEKELFVEYSVKIEDIIENLHLILSIQDTKLFTKEYYNYILNMKF